MSSKNYQIGLALLCFSANTLVWLAHLNVTVLLADTKGRSNFSIFGAMSSFNVFW